jgi:iron complex outermembrane receptor protein
VRVRASGDFPISDTLSMSLSGLYRRADGWQKVPNAPDYGDEDAMSARLQLRWRPTDDVDVLFATDGRRQRQNGQPHNTIANLLTAPFAAFSRPFFGPCCELTRDPDRAAARSPYQDDDADAWNSSLTVSFPFASGTLKSISAYRQVSAFFGRGINSINPNYYGDFHHEKSKQFSQEIQYSNTFFDDRVDFVGGLYYFRERSLDHTNLYVAPGLILQPGFPALLSAIGLPAAAAPNFDINLDFDNRQTTINYAVFGNATVKLTDQVSLDLGGRYTYEKKRFFQRATRVFAQRPLIPQAPQYTLEDSWRAFTPKATLSYQANPDLLLYGTYSIGFRSGGFNGRPTQFAEIGSYNPERLRSLEAGLKSDLLDGRLRLNLAAFANRYKNQLQQVNTIAADGITIIARVQNAGRSHMYGGEAEATVVFNKNVSVDGSVAYLKAGYDRYVSNGVDLSYLKLRNSPRWTANLGLNVRGEISDGVEASFRIDAAYKDRVELDTLNSPFLSAPDYVIANINFGIDFVDKGISLRFTAENITDERVLIGGFDVSRSFGVVEGYYNTPRRFYGTISYHF